MTRPERRFAPLWTYLFGLFALAAAQRLLVPPDEHGAAFNVIVFFVGAAAVLAVLTALERATKSR